MNTDRLLLHIQFVVGGENDKASRFSIFDKN